MGIRTNSQLDDAAHSAAPLSILAFGQIAGVLRTLFLPCLAIGVASVSFRLSRGFVLDHARDTVFLGLLARVGLGSRRSLGICLSLGGLGANALLFLELYPFALRATFFPGCGDSEALGLACGSVRFCSFLRRMEPPEKVGFCFRSGAATVGEVIALDVFQIRFRSRFHFLRGGAVSALFQEADILSIVRFSSSSASRAFFSRAAFPRESARPRQVPRPRVRASNCDEPSRRRSQLVGKLCDGARSSFFPRAA